MGVRVRQKTKGKRNPWWVFITHNGKKTSRKIGDKKAAEAVKSQIEAKLQLGEFGFEDPKPVPTLAEYAPRWLFGYVKIQCRESTFDEYESVLRNHVLPAFKDQGIDAISRGDVRDFLLSRYNSGLFRQRVTFIKDVLSGVFNYALDDGLIKTNPATGITKNLFPKSLRTTRQLSEDDVFTKDQLEYFLKTCEADFPEWHLFFLMAARTGMRLGELLALRWKDVDLKNNYIWVRRSYRSCRFTKPKNGRDRKVDMSNQLASVLREKLRHGFKEVDGLVYQKNGQAIGQKDVRRRYIRILKKAKIRYVKLHGLRHAFCAHLLSEDVSPYYVSQQVGYSSINITCDIYGSWICSDENRHVNLLDPEHSSAPLRHPTETEKPQPIQIVSDSL